MNQIKAHLATFAQSISDNVERIRQYEGKIPQIEIDILLESVRNFYTNVLELSKTNIGMDNSDSHIVINTLHEEQVDKAEEPAVKAAAVEEITYKTAVIAATAAEKESEHNEPTVVEKEAMKEIVAETGNIATEAENREEEAGSEQKDEDSDEAFETIMKNESILQEIANDDVLPTESIITFESVEYERPMEDKPVVVNSEPEAVAEEQTSAAEKNIQPVEEPKEALHAPQPAAEEAAAVAKTTTAEKEDKQALDTVETNTEESHEESRQISLFDYLKSSSVSRAVEQVDRFSGVAVKTLADKFQESKEKEKILFEVAHEREPQKRRVEDLRTIIGINDKILFMSDLFGKNMKAYNDFILRLNKIDDTQEALEYLKTVEETYKWDKESLAVQSFIKIFERKFK